MSNGLIIPGIALPGQHRLQGGKNLDGSLWLAVDGGARITMPPRAAFDVAVAMLKTLGLTVNYTPDQLPQ